MPGFNFPPKCQFMPYSYNKGEAQPVYRVFPDSGLRVSDSQITVLDSQIIIMGVLQDSKRTLKNCEGNCILNYILVDL